MTDFYTALADDYDGMTKFETRLPSLRSTLETVLGKHPPKAALDVACGTGICAIALAELGIDVVGTDPNPGMVDKARENAARLARTNVRFEIAAMQDEVTDLQRVDLITCLGNSIPHIERRDLPAVADRFLALLTTGGEAIIQLKNFERILDEGNRFVGAGRLGDKEMIRFYDLSEDIVTFNVLRLNWEGDRARPDWIQTRLTPFTRTGLERAFLDAGFSNVTFYATVNRDPFDCKSSQDLVVVATAP